MSHQFVNRLQHLALTQKIFLLVCSATCLTLLLIWVGNVLAVQHAQAQLDTIRMTQEVTFIQQQFHLTEDELRQTALYLAAEFAEIHTFGEPASATSLDQLQQFVLQHRLSFSLEHLELLDTSRESMLGQRADGIPGLQAVGEQALRGQTGIRLSYVPLFDWMILVSAPLIREQEVVGAVIIGEVIDKSFLAHINVERRNPVLRLHNKQGRVIISTGRFSTPHLLDAIDQALWQQALNTQQPSNIERLTTGHDNYLCQYAPVTLPGDDVMIFSLHQVERDGGFRFLATFSPTLLGIIALVVGLGWGGYLFSHWLIVRPVQELKQFVDRLNMGGRHQPTPVLDQNELHVIAHQTQSLAEQLQYAYQQRDNQIDKARQPLREENELLQEKVRHEQALALQAKDLAKTAINASQSKSQFLADMSHELRTPLNAVIGMTRLLLETRLSDDQQEYTSTISASGKALLTLINQILDLSKIEAGKLELEQAVFSLRGIVSEVMALLAPKAAETGLELYYIISLDTPDELLGDENRFRQILLNLLNNAIKFTHSGDVSLHIWSETMRGAQHRLHFSVRDTGAGMTDSQQQQIFSPYRQADVSIARKYGGTGLGLVISKRLVELMEGEIWVESELGVGSNFQFYILTERQPSPKLDYLRPNLPRLFGKKLLLAHAHPIAGEALANQLQHWGMSPTRVTSGQQAMALIQRGQLFDFALIDHRLEDGEGVKLIKHLRFYYNPQTLPLLLMTQIGFQLNQLPTPESQKINGALSKPIDPHDLYHALINVVEGRMIDHAASTNRVPLDHRFADEHPLDILLAEDNPVNQKVALHLLGKMGYQLDVVDNGQAVLDQLRRKRYDLILMDIQMPIMDGVQTTQTIRKTYPPSRQPYIIALTADALLGNREKYIALGVDDYLSKPVQVRELTKALLNVQRAGLEPDPSSATEVKTDEPPIAEAAVNLDYLWGLVGEDQPDAIRDLIDGFLENTTDRLAHLETALENEDYQTAKILAHTMKGSSASFGASTYSAMCLEFEHLVMAQNNVEMPSLLARIQAEYAKMQAQLIWEREQLSI